MSQRPLCIMSTLLSKKSARTPSSKISTVRYNAPNALVVGNHTIQNLTEISLFQTDGSWLVDTDAMKHKC